MKVCNQIQSAVSNLAKNSKLGNQWLADMLLIDALAIKDIVVSKSIFNKTMSSITILQSVNDSQISSRRNTTNTEKSIFVFNSKRQFYHHTKKIKCTFYYIKEGSKPPPKLGNSLECSKVYQFKLITRSLLGGFAIDRPIDEPDDSSHNLNPTNPPLIHRFTSTKRRLEVLTEIGGYWDSPEMKRLFNSLSGETIPCCLIRRIEKLDILCDARSSLVGYIDHVEENLLTEKQLHIIGKRSRCLRACYLSALKEMETVRNWEKICMKTYEALQELGIDTYDSPRTSKVLHDHPEP